MALDGLRLLALEFPYVNEPEYLQVLERMYKLIFGDNLVHHPSEPLEFSIFSCPYDGRSPVCPCMFRRVLLQSVPKA